MCCSAQGEGSSIESDILLVEAGGGGRDAASFLSPPSTVTAGSRLAANRPAQPDDPMSAWCGAAAGRRLPQSWPRRRAPPQLGFGGWSWGIGSGRLG